jgi:hypothetical protein
MTDRKKSQNYDIWKVNEAKAELYSIYEQERDMVRHVARKEEIEIERNIIHTVTFGI